MKLDMHCHTHEGSVDSKIGVEEYIRILIEKGYDGMLITDHDTYNGYRYWKEHLKGKKYKDFVVLKGIEYDTNNAGHMLVVMPENVKAPHLGNAGDAAADAALCRACVRWNRGPGSSVR